MSMTKEDVREANEAKVRASRMSLGLPSKPDQLRGDMEQVAFLQDRYDRLNGDLEKAQAEAKELRHNLDLEIAHGLHAEEEIKRLGGRGGDTDGDLSKENEHGEGH